MTFEKSPLLSRQIHSHVRIRMNLRYLPRTELVLVLGFGCYYLRQYRWINQMAINKIIGKAATVRLTKLILLKFIALTAKKRLKRSRIYISKIIPPPPNFVKHFPTKLIHSPFHFPNICSKSN